jgi:choline dehydrogenase-like flavoprotein
MTDQFLTEARMAVLRAVCDTVVPAIEHSPDPFGHWARSASSYGVPESVAEMLGVLPPDQQQGMGQLLDALAGQGFVGASQASREQILRNASLGSPDAAVGIGALGGLTLLLHYGAPDPATGRNPAWDMLGYPGPLGPPPAQPKPIEPLALDGDTTLDADVVVVGSGAGGGVIAAELAHRGASVVVVEAGGYFNEADFNQYELWAWQNLYWRGGPTPTMDRNVTLQAGSCLGGGTVVNWTNCLRTKPWVRREWAAEHGLTDVADDFDRHLDAVWSRLSVNDQCSDLNMPHRVLQRGAQALGWSFQAITRNADRACYDPASAGYMGFGDQSGSKQSTMKTYLQDAFDAGAKIVVGCFVDRVLTEGGRADGVVGRSVATGAELTVRARHVVLAAGALESPGILLRSGLGGPAVGRHLRLHPSTAVFGAYGEEMQPWWGPPQSGLIDEFVAEDDGYGLLIEGVQYTTGLGASAIPWLDARQHKQALEDYRGVGTSVALIRDRGDINGWVELDPTGTAQPFYSLLDPGDQNMVRRGLEAQVRCHAAAGASQISVLAESLPVWNRGDDLEGFIRRVSRIPLRAGGVRMFAAHQMGSCRMGADPANSVASTTGELHDTPGVWIGDASAFPTASGTNPMITIMALAHRTAEQLAQAAGAGATRDRALQEA